MAVVRLLLFQLVCLIQSFRNLSQLPPKNLLLLTLFLINQILKPKKELIPATNYMSKVNNRNTKTRCEISSELTIKRPERWQWGHFGVIIVNFEHISYLALVFLLLTLSR